MRIKGWDTIDTMNSRIENTAKFGLMDAIGFSRDYFEYAREDG